jgi:hypothetical protein
MQPNNPYYQQPGQQQNNGAPLPAPRAGGQQLPPMFQPSAPQGPVPGMPGPAMPIEQMPAPAPARSHNDSGNAKTTILVVAIAILTVLFLGSAGFGYWAYAERTDYKENVDAKIAAASEVVRKNTTEENNKKFAEEYKNPLKVYTGPASLGTIHLEFPKTWSGYVDVSERKSTPLEALFHPEVVNAPKQGDARQAVALKIEVREQQYDKILKLRESDVEKGVTKATPYALPKMPEEVGIKFTGELDEKFNGVEIVIPLRDKTIVITSESDLYLKDLNKYILPNITFIP